MIPDIPLTDAALMKRIKKLGKVQRNSLWTEVNLLGGFFAMTGATGDAIAIWDFAGSGKIPIPDYSRPGTSIFVQCAIAMPHSVRSWLAKEGGTDQASDATVAAADLEKIVSDNDLAARRTIATGFYPMGPELSEPPLSETPKGRLHKALLLAKPRDDGRPATTEIESLSILADLLAQPHSKKRGLEDLAEFDRTMAGLLAVDIAARNGRRAEAIGLLRDCYKFLVKSGDARAFWYQEGLYTFTLKSIVGLLCEGALKDKSKLSAEERAELISEIKALASEVPARAFPTPKDPENALVLRTDFSDDAAWDATHAAILEPRTDMGFDTGFVAYVEFVSDRYYEGMKVKKLTPLAQKGLGTSFLFVVDHLSITHPERPILVIDLDEEPGRTSRAAPGEVGTIGANLSTGNMGWEDFSWLEGLDEK